MIRAAIKTIASLLPAPRVIYDRDGQTPYLSRYYLIGRPTHPSGEPFDQFGNPKPGIELKDGLNVYLHRFHRSDDDLELHNHPWAWAFSLILAGGYREERRWGNAVVTQVFKPGSLNIVHHDTFHRIELLDGDSWSLFVAGPKANSWGFWNRDTGTFTPWREFLARKKALREDLDAALRNLRRDLRDIRQDLDNLQATRSQR
jgi:hypothetical protein